MIDDVYRVVLVILNKNDKGVITPDRFNDLANAVQLKIFSEIPNDIRLAINRKNAGRGENSVSQLGRPLERLMKSVDVVRSSYSPYYFHLPDDLYELTSVYDLGRKIEGIAYDKLRTIESSSLVCPTRKFPVYAVTGNDFEVLPREVMTVTVNYRRKISTPRWTYIRVGNQSVFNSADPLYCDFELDDYFFNRIVIDILAYAGLHLREQDVVQVSAQMENTDFNKEKMS